MPEIVDARAAPMFVKGLPLAKAYSLADPREVVAGAAVAGAFAILEQEERYSASTKDPVPFCAVGPEPFSCAWRYRNEAAFAVLPAPDGQHCFIEIDILVVESDCLAHAQSGDGDQPEERRTGPCAQPV